MFAIACAHPHPDPAQVRERAELWAGSTVGSASCPDASKAVTAASLADSDLARAGSTDWKDSTVSVVVPVFLVASAASKVVMDLASAGCWAVLAWVAARAD
jgi:hypothetical protein